MPDLQTLLAQRAELDAQIAAYKPQAVAQVRALMASLGVTPADLGLVVGKVAAPRPVKYRDEEGHTWTGVGQRPRWLAARLRAGATLEQFAVR